MSSLDRLSPVLLCLTFVASTAACTSTSETAGDPASDSSDVVSVENLEALEAELGLEHDTRDDAGNWSRDVAKGDCYAKSRAATPRWEYRRYRTGAAFFDKEANAPGRGASRPVVCLDLDVGGNTESLDPFMIDAALRYHLGGFEGSDCAMASCQIRFARGSFAGESRSHTCTALMETQQAYEECIKATSHTLMARTMSGIDLATLRTTAGAEIEIAVANVVDRYVAKKATAADVFDMRRDPVGAFASAEPPAADGWTHVRYSRLDAHAYRQDKVLKVAITPKNSDKDIEGSAIVLCVSSGKMGEPYDCEQPGAPLAP